MISAIYAYYLLIVGKYFNHDDSTDYEDVNMLYLNYYYIMQFFMAKLVSFIEAVYVLPGSFFHDEILNCEFRQLELWTDVESIFSNSKPQC
jgi:hypothetical protein